MKGGRPQGLAGSPNVTGVGPGWRRHRVVIVGAGFGGLFAAKALGRAEVEVTVVDRTNHHLFQPLLYQWPPASSPRAISPRRCGMSCGAGETRA